MCELKMRQRQTINNNYLTGIDIFQWSDENCFPFDGNNFKGLFFSTTSVISMVSKHEEV